MKKKERTKIFNPNINCMVAPLGQITSMKRGSSLEENRTCKKRTKYEVKNNVGIVVPLPPPKKR